MRTSLACLAIVMIICCSAHAERDTTECLDSVLIDSLTYEVPQMWCGRKVDSSLLADPALLRKLPDSFSFKDFRIYLIKQARDAFEDMARAARSDSIGLAVRSGYRSARYQRKLIKKRLDEGQTFEEVARYVAPPGYSTHETGRATDISAPNEPGIPFYQTQAYQWLLQNGARFGFYEKYPKTGMPWEPWHWELSDSLLALIEQTDADSISAPAPD